MNLWIPFSVFLTFCGICFVVSRVSLPKKNTDPTEDEALQKSLGISISEFKKFREIRDSNPAYLGKKIK